MPIDSADIPTETGKLGSQIAQRHCLVHRSALLQAVVVNYGNEVAQL